MKRILVFFLVVSLLGSVVAGVFIIWGYYYITRDLPKLSTIEDYQPAAVSQVYARDGTLIAEFYKERRYPVKLSAVPEMVRKSFLAAEDASFYSHPGIDPRGILRALIKNVQSGEAKQGGSTITQQIVKNLLLTPERTITRKLKEAILAYRLEKRFSKDEIFEMYLNEIFFGNTAYGIKAAAKVYFHKELADLSLAEAAMLAGLPKAPSRFSPISHPKRAKERQEYVLSQMVKAGFVTQDEADRSSKEELQLYRAASQNIYHAPYYVSEVRRILAEKWHGLNIDTSGLEIHTALDLRADQLAQASIVKGLKEVDKRRGWRGPVAFIPRENKEKFLETYAPFNQRTQDQGDIFYAMVREVSRASGVAKIDLGKEVVDVNLKEAAWARRKIDSSDRVTWIQPEEIVRPGDVIEVSILSVEEDKKSPKDPQTNRDPEQKPVKFSLDQTPDVEGALVLYDPYSGKVRSLIGGYSYQRSVFNRATQSYRQPGSAFKPIVYLAAIDGFHYTPATLVYDMPRTFRVGEEFWTPGNFDETYMGAITLRVALEKSRNLVSADIVSRIGVDAVIQYAKKLGIESRLGRNLSLALGSSEVTLLELTKAYGVFPAKGVLFETVFVTKIVDRFTNVLYDNETEALGQAKQVIDENSAFIMANLMKGVVEHGTGYRVKEIKRPVGGKTGTSNDQMDAWFVGFTPHWVCGVWVGFDVKKEIGGKETGGRVAAPIWLYFMRDFLNFEDRENYAKLVDETKAEAERLGIEYVPPEPLEPLDFSVPEGIDPFWVNKITGVRSEPSDPGAIYEYFIKGTEPALTVQGQDATSSYLESPEM